MAQGHGASCARLSRTLRALLALSFPLDADSREHITRSSREKTRKNMAGFALWLPNEVASHLLARLIRTTS